MSDLINLRAVKDGDAFIIVDQDGRKVSKIRNINIDASTDDATCITISFFSSSESDGRAHLNRVVQSRKDADQ